MLQAVPKHWYSWDYTVYDDQDPIAELDVSWWREKGVLTIDSIAHRIFREGIMSGAFILELDSEVLARAEKPSALSRRIVIQCGGSTYSLIPRSMFGRSFQLVDHAGVVGTLSPRGLFSRRMTIDLPAGLPLAVRVFIVWLTVILWKRDSDAAGAG